MKRWHRFFLTFCCVFLLVCLGFFAMRSLQTPGLFSSHDGELHVTRLLEFDRAIRDGQFPPQWAGRFFGGIGSPVLMLNYQLPYWVAITGTWLGLSVIDAFKLTIALTYILSGVFAFFAFRHIFNTKAGIVGAVIYTWAPYRFVDIYVRGAFGEAFSFLFPPLILLGVHKRSPVLLILSLAGLFLSHPVASALFSMLFLGYTVVLELQERRQKQVKKSSKQISPFGLLLVSFLIAVAIAAWNLVPTLALTRYTHYAPENSIPLAHFPTVKQLMFGHWGFGGSTPNNDHDSMSFHIGSAQLVVIGMSLIILFFLVRDKKRKQKVLLPFFMFASMCIAILLMLHQSGVVWQYLGLTHILDFPWRILLVVVFIAAYLAAWIISISLPMLGNLLAYTLIGLSIFTNLEHLSINSIVPRSVEQFTQNLGTGDAYGEYSSVWRASRMETAIARRAEIIEGMGTLLVTKSRSNKLELGVHATKPITLRLNIMYFPGWQIWINGTKQTIDQTCSITRATDESSDYSGLIFCELPVGNHLIEARYVSPSPQRVGDLVSLAGIAGFLWIASQSFSPHITSRQTLLRSSKRSRKS